MGHVTHVTLMRGVLHPRPLYALMIVGLSQEGSHLQSLFLTVFLHNALTWGLHFSTLFPFSTKGTVDVGHVLSNRGAEGWK
jgi:hypothetical protein